MNGTDQLHKVVELATRKRDAALQDCARVQQEQQQALLQMSQLQGYTTESQQRWMLRANQGVPATLLHSQHTFMNKLEHAMVFQQGVLNQLALRLQQRKTQLVEAERELASLKKYQQRRLQAWQQGQQRQEQRSTDEMAATQHRQHAQAHPWRPSP